MVDLSKMAVSAKAVSVKAFSECNPTNQRTGKAMYHLNGTVTRAEAIFLENALRLFRREAGSLEPEELNLVASLLALKGRVK